MDPIAILQNRIEQLEAKLGVASGQQGGDSRVQAGDSVAANLMSAHAAMASGAAGHEKVTAAMAQATELNNYTSPDVMQHMQQRQMQMHEVAAAEPAIRHHCHCMHKCKQAAPALESDVIAQVPQMQATVDHMKADTVSIKSDADAQSQLNSPRPNIQQNGKAQMASGMQPQMAMQGNPNTMNGTPVYHATVQNNTPFQGYPNVNQGSLPAQADPNTMQGYPNQMRGTPNTPNVRPVPNEWQRNRQSMFGGHNVASAMRGNPIEITAVHGKDLHGNPKVTHVNSNAMHGSPNEMHDNPQLVHGLSHHAPNVMNENPMVHGNVDAVAAHASVPYAHPNAVLQAGHVHPNTMPHAEHHSNAMPHPEHAHPNAMPHAEHHSNAMPHPDHAHPSAMPHPGHTHPNSMPHAEHAHPNAIMHPEHMHPNAMPNSGHVHTTNAMPHQMVHGSHEAHVENMTLSGHVPQQIAQPASPRSPVPEVTQGIQQLAETCGATAGLASEQLANVTQKVEQAEQRKFQRRNGLD